MLAYQGQWKAYQIPDGDLGEVVEALKTGTERLKPGFDLGVDAAAFEAGELAPCS